jgi:hypothetical protein
MKNIEHFIIGQPQPGMLETACGDTVPLFPIPAPDATRCTDCEFLLTVDPTLDPGDDPDEGVVFLTIIEVGPFPTDPAA